MLFCLKCLFFKKQTFEQNAKPPDLKLSKDFDSFKSFESICLFAGEAGGMNQSMDWLLADAWGGQNNHILIAHAVFRIKNSYEAPGALSIDKSTFYEVSGSEILIKGVDYNSIDTDSNDSYYDNIGKA